MTFFPPNGRRNLAARSLPKHALALGLGVFLAFAALAGAQPWTAPAQQPGFSASTARQSGSTLPALKPASGVFFTRDARHRLGYLFLKDATNLIYRGGPVIPSAHVVFIFWGPSFNNVASSDYNYARALQGFRNQFGTTPEYNTITQYSGSNGVIALTNLAAGTADWFDTTTPPANVTDSISRDEVNAYLSAHAFDASAIYQVVLPISSYSTFLGYSSCGGPNPQYCAYHNFYVSGANTVKYSVEPYPTCGSCVVAGWSADQNQERLITHETREAVTDPQLNTWTDANSFEADDKCALTSPPFLGTGGYGYQDEWSNASSACVTSTPIAPPPNYVGTLEHAGCDTLVGWAADFNRLNTPITVSFYDGATLLTTVLANGSRPDIGASLGDNGLHGFSFATPLALRDGLPHTLFVRFESSGTNLASSPASLTCSPPPSYVGTLDHAGCDTLTGWGADRNRLNTPINVSFYDGATLLTTVLANQSRPDVGAFLGDNGLHGFSFTTPSVLRDGNTHTLSARFESSGTNLASSPVALSCRNHLDHASFVLPDGTGHSFYLDANLHVIHLSLSSAGTWQKQDLTVLTSASLAEPGSALTALVDSAGNGRVFYAGTNHHVMQLKLDTTNTWTQGDVMTQAGTSNTAAAGSALTSFGAAGSSAVHVLYLDASQHVNDLARTSAGNTGTWSNQDLTALTSAGLAVPGSALTGLVDSLGNGRAFYVGTNQHVFQLKLDTTNTWTQGDVMVQAGTSNTAASGSALITFGAAGSSAVHVLYLDASQHVNDLARTSAGSGTWGNQDLTALTSAGLAVPGSALSGLVDSIGNGRVFYVGTNQHVLQLKLDTTNTWTQDDVMVQAGTSRTAAPGSGLTSFGAAGGSAVHVLYLDSIQHVNDLVRTSAGSTGTWSDQDVSALTGP